MAYEIDALPYGEDALSPVISARTVALHYGKHHQGYAKKLSHALDGDSRDGRFLVELIRSEEPGSDVFNFAAQVWNHDFYWKSLTPEARQAPTGAFADAIARDFGSLDKLESELAEAAGSEFGSGWAWLAAEPGGRLCVLSTTDAENPLRRGLTPLLTIDVWEHAYYLDHQNERDRYMKGVIDELLDWRFAETHWTKARNDDPKQSR